MILQQSWAQFFNSHWHDCSTVTGMIVQQSLARLFNCYWYDSSTITAKTFFFYTGRILQQWYSLLKNRAMYQEYDIWSQLKLHSVDSLFQVCYKSVKTLYSLLCFPIQCLNYLQLKVLVCVSLSLHKIFLLMPLLNCCSISLSQMCIQDHIKHLRWSVLWKQLAAFSR